MVAALITLLRTAPPTDHEEMLLDRAIRVLDERHDGVPVLADLVQVIADAPDELREVAFDRGDLERYQDATDPLLKTLIGLLGRGRLGEMFSAETTTPMRRDRPVVFDVSSIDDAELALQRAALMACWSYGFGAINVANALADAGLEPQRHYFVILDELWRALRGGRGMVDRVDALTRLNRQRGVGTGDDLAHDERPAGAAGRGRPHEGARLRRALRHGRLRRSARERDVDALAASPPSAAPSRTCSSPGRTRRPGTTSARPRRRPPGRGNFLVKVGGRPGIPVHVALTKVEEALNDTNKRWHSASRLGDAEELAA